MTACASAEFDWATLEGDFNSGHGRVSWIHTKNVVMGCDFGMYAYIDESGSTGANLFDPNQPYFLTVAMSSPVDFDSVFRERVAGIARSAEVSYLHANEMGVAGVESIAGRILDLVEFAQAKFHFVAVKKPDVAAIKFYDAIFDPWENPSAPPHGYAVRALRFMLLLRFASILTEEDARDFWDVMMHPKSSRSEAKAVEVIERVIPRVSYLPDCRSRQLIRDGLEGARRNIGELSFWLPDRKGKYGNLPNIFALPWLLQRISLAAKAWNTEVGTITHDRQSQFEGTLRQWHSLFANIEPDVIISLGDTPLQFGDVRNSKFQIANSRESPGLQVVDIVLWTFSRQVLDRPLGPVSAELYGVCLSPGDVYLQSLKGISDELEPILRRVNATHLSQHQIEQAKVLLEEFERERLTFLDYGV